MTYKEELARIRSGEVKQVYLLYGEEVWKAREFEKAVIEALLPPNDRENGLMVFDQEPDLRDLINHIETAPFWSEKNVIVVRNTSLFRASRKNKAAENDEEVTESTTMKPGEDALIDVLGNMPPYSCVVFSITAKKENKTYKEIDKRRKSYKTVEKQGVTVEVAPMQIGEAREWVQNKLLRIGKRLERPAAEHIWSAVSLMNSISIGFLENELNKIDLYTGNRTVITKKDIVEIMSAVPEASIFAMVDAMSRKQIQEALILLEQQLAGGVHPLIILTLLSRQVRLLWQVKEFTINGNSATVLAQRLKLPAFVIEKMQQQSRGFAVETLQRAMLALADADRDLKSGKATSAVFEIILIDMCR